jgi:cytochrome P450
MVAPTETASQRAAAGRTVVGPLALIDFIRRVRRDQLTAIAPESFRADLTRNRLLFLDTFLVNKPEYIEHVLLTNHANYRKSHFLRQLLGPLIGRGLLISEGDFWRRQRRIAAPAFHSRRVAGLVATMAACAEATAARWAGTAGAVDVAAEMAALTLDVIARTMLATDVAAEIAKVRRLTEVVINVRPGILDLLGLPAWIPRGRSRAYREAIAGFDALVARFLAERRERPADRGDLLAMLLAARDAETGEGMSDPQLRDEILTFFLAGHETSANALSWIWYLLARHPEAERRLHEELRRVLAGRPPAAADLPSLQWTRMVIEEALRLYPPAHAIRRAAIGEDRLGDTRVPPGAVVTISMFVTHRNPKLWPDPERFDPERFAPAAVAARHRFAYLPFGGGPRICIGNSFAMAEIMVAIAVIAQRYRLRLAADRPVEPVGLLTLRPKGGMRMTIEPRQRNRS